MDDFKGKVAAITGAASGIGLAVARRAQAQGMRLALCDINFELLEQVGGELGEAPLIVRADTRERDQVEAFAEQTIARFGAAHLLFNNAGVGGGGAFQETSLDEWEWIVGVNFWGVLHCLRAFLPHMRRADEGHIVNTSSVAGLLSCPEMAPYNVAKHAVVTLSETLFCELRNAQSPLGVSVLCPSFVDTEIALSARHRELFAEESESDRADLLKTARETTRAFMSEAGMPPERVAELVFDAVAARRFYILTHPRQTREQVELRMRAILDDGEPPMSGPQDFPIAFD